MATLAQEVVSLRPRCLVTDLDRTLTGPDLVLHPAINERIRELRASGLRVVIATGRRSEEVAAMGLAARVDAVVAENGAVIVFPNEGSSTTLHSDFAAQAAGALGRASLAFEWGRVIGSGPRELAQEASDALLRAGVAHHLEFNAEQVMLLPPATDKATGATRCLERFGLTAESAWAIGDGENDVALLEWASFSAAPANAADPAKAAADLLLEASYFEGFLAFTQPLLAQPLVRGRPSPT